MKLLTAIIIILSLMAVNCRKDVGDPLPPETHTGAYTFGCKVDGKVYATNGKPVFEDFVGDGSVYYAPNVSWDSTIYISAVHIFPDFEFNISIPFPSGTGTYSLGKDHYYGLFQDKEILDTTGLQSIYRTSATDTGSVTITYFDGSYMPFNGGTVLAGTFQMDAVNGEGKVIHITEGRFDIGK